MSADDHIATAADALFQALHGHAHESDDGWLTEHGTSVSPGEGRSIVTCRRCGFVAGVAFRDPLEVSVHSGVTE